MKSNESDPKADQINQEVADLESKDPVNRQPQMGLIRQESTALEPKKPIIPDSELFEYAGSDSTAVVDITILEAKDDEDGSDADEDYGILKWMESCTDPDFPLSRKIEEGIEIVKALTRDYNLLINRTQKKLADRAILLGKFFLALKELVRQKGDQWMEWAEKNLPFIERRSREKYMRLAGRKDCHRLSSVGIERMDLICTATKDLKVDDPTDYFLSKYNIQFDPKSEDSVADLKNRIDSALNQERLSKEGFEPNFDLVSSLTLVGVSFDKGLIKTMKSIRDCGGNPEAYLGKLSLNQGKDDAGEDAEKRLQDFNSLAQRLIRVVDNLLKNPDQALKVDTETFSQLMSRIKELQKVGNFPPPEEQVA